MAKKVLRVVFGIVIALVAVYVILSLITRPADDHPFLSGTELLVMAHQGGKGLWPDNTLLAFENAVKLGVDVLEMDVHSTADDVIVVIHDATVDDTTDGRGAIQDYSLEELKRLDAGYHWTEDGQTFPFRGQGVTVPALEELFERFPGVLMNIEIKQTEPSMAKPLCELIKAYDREDQTLVASFDSQTIRSFREECPAVATSVAETEVRTFFILNTLRLAGAYRPQGEAFQVPEYSGGLHVVTDRFIGAADKHNMDVHVWTVNEEEDMRRMIDLGVGGIITDYPDKLMNILGRRVSPVQIE